MWLTVRRPGTPVVFDTPDHAVGLEFGWRHAGGCTCAYCQSGRPERDKAATVWDSGRASA